MGGTTVSELNNFFFGMANDTLMQTAESTGEFASDLEKAAKKEVDVISEDVTPKSTKTTVATSNNGKAVKEASTQTETNSTVKVDEVPEEVTEAVGTMMQTIVSEAAEVLSVNPEELAAALDKIELSTDALFNPEAVNQIVMELNGIDNPIDLVSDANAWNQVLAVNDLASTKLTELSNELGVTGNELLDLLQETALADGIEEAIPVITADEILNNSQEELQLNTNTQSEVKSDVFNGADAQMINEVTEMEHSNAADKKDAKEDSSDMNQAGANQTVANTSNDANSVQTTQTQETFESHVSPQEIYEQIGDFIKTQNFEDVKSVEMQLSPATLGSIQIKISQTDSGITAQLIASNEAAKSALESQLITLKENFDEAGIKVNEVEVSVSNQSFNENLEQDGNSERDREAMMEEHRHQTQRLNLNIFDEGYEDIELTDEIKLAKEIMEANGGSVDLKA